MDAETRHLVEEAAMAILCVHPELAQKSCLREEMLTDRKYRTIFSMLREDSRLDEVTLSEYHVKDTADSLRSYHLGDKEMWGDYERFFHGYEKRLSNDYISRRHDILATQLSRREIDFTDFIDQYEKVSHAAPLDDGALSFEGMKRMLHSARDPIVIPGLEKLSAQLKLGTTDLVTVGGGPARGKSAFMLNMAERFSRDPRYQVVYYNIEMDSATAISRLVCCVGDATMKDMESAQRDDYCPAVEKAMREIDRRGNLFLVNGMTDIDEICADVLRRHEKGRTMAVFIDYIGLVTTTREIKGYSVIQDVVKRFRVFALRHKLLVVMASQLTRDSTINNTESLYSYADSSEIERSSTHALLLTLPEGSAAYETAQLARQRHARLITLEVSKNRNGSAGRYQFEFDLDRQKFVPLAGGKD